MKIHDIYVQTNAAAPTLEIGPPWQAAIERGAAATAMLGARRDDYFGSMTSDGRVYVSRTWPVARLLPTASAA